MDWWCEPRFDSASVFGRLLGSDAGHWTLRPTAAFEIERQYVTDSLVLQTVFTTAHGKATVTDALGLELGARGHAIGLRSPNVLLRRVEGSQGTIEMTTEFAPRMEYGTALRPSVLLFEPVQPINCISPGIRLPTRVLDLKRTRAGLISVCLVHGFPRLSGSVPLIGRMVNDGSLPYADLQASAITCWRCRSSACETASRRSRRTVTMTGCAFRDRRCRRWPCSPFCTLTRGTRGSTSSACSWRQSRAGWRFQALVRLL